MMSTIIERENTYTSGVYGKRGVAIVRGSGASLWDAEGREYIDCIGGYGVSSIGHARPEIAAALAAQAQVLVTCPELMYNDVRARYLERLAQVTPDGLDAIFLCNSGTEAVEGALKFARLATGRSGIVAMLRSFHGRTMGALSATWEPHYREPFAPLVPGITHVRYNNLAAADAAITEQTAAVILELVQGEGGVHVASEEFVQGLAILCRERGALLIVDEVQTGFGRTGKLFACQHYNLQPDILCLAKAIAGGMPMGAICLGPRVTESGHISKGVHGSTFGGNPLACAAALTALDIYQREALPERAARLGTHLLERLHALQSPLIREVRGHGLLIGIELTRRVQPYLEALLERGVLALQAGPNVIRLLPPLVISEEQIERVLEALEAILVPVGAGVDDVVGRGPLRSPLPGEHEASVSPVGAGVVGATEWGPSGSPVLDGKENGGYTGSFPYGRPQGSSPRISPSPAPTGKGAVSPTEGDPEGPHPSSSATSAPTGMGNHEVALLQNMLTIPSYSGEEGALAHFLVGQARQMGLYAYVDEVGNCVASTHEEGNGEQPIVLLGHMDTVRGDIAVRLEDGVLYGRGAVDAKGPLAAFLCATARLTSSGNVRRPVIVVGAVEEEAATSRGARAVVDRYRPSACIIGEPSGSQAVTIGYKGRLLVEYRIARPMSHSAGEQQHSNEVAASFWDRVRSHAETWNTRHVAQSASPTTGGINAAPTTRHVTQSAFASLLPSLRSFNSTQVGLEEQATVLIGYRLPPAFDSDALRTELEQWAREDGASIRFSGEEQTYQTTRTTPLARSFIAALRATGVQPTFKHKTGTSDMNVVGPIWGQNIVAYGPGDSRLDHTPQEHIQIAEYLHAIDVLERVLRDQTTLEHVVSSVRVGTLLRSIS